MGKRSRRRRNRKVGKNIHHRRSRKLNGSNKAENLSDVDVKRHALWHQMFSGDMTVQQIVDEINEVWIDPDFILTVRRR